MADDLNLSTYQVRYFSKGEERTDLVLGHNDEHDTGTDEYRVWRVMPNTVKVTAFRCRMKDWIATASLANPPATPAQLEELARLRAENAVVHERAGMAEIRASDMQRRLVEAERAAANGRDELAAARKALAAHQYEIERLSKPRVAVSDDVPF